ncbi:ArsA family ATPase [Streptomyces gobiensis]|uniref:ArsA family ATPase n=1 Tax=Streptomyces gobiensis TaxID=2875706 RepID=UPI001E5AA733|nr:ArsA-related P-loop ATPase [Streptomyces gobiensis]UGY90917.1 ArsA family ATPase [Streptomyces gobiensis]
MPAADVPDEDPARAQPPRTVLVTGAAGAGRTTVAAATAQAAAEHGRRTVLLSADRKGAAELAAPELPVIHIDSGEHFRSQAAALQERSQGALDMLGARPLDTDELTELPGAEAFATLHALRSAYENGAWETVVVDLPPVQDAIRLLGLPEQLRRYLQRLVPAERQAARALRPVLAQLAGVPMPARWLYETAERWQRELAAVQRVIEAPGTSVRLVVDPGPATARTVDSARAGLALHGLPLDVVIANRTLPTGSCDPWLAGFSGEQQTACKEIRDALGPVPLRELPNLGRAPRDAAELAGLGAPVPGAPAARPVPWVEDRLAQDAELVWRLPLPGAVKEQLSLVRRGDEVIVTAGPFRRALPLDGALRRCTVAGARLAEGELAVRFVPDPGLWPVPR